MLEIRQLTKRCKGNAAVENVSFTIRPGEILGYIGPNGARDAKLYFSTEQARPAVYFPLRPSSAGATLMAKVAPGLDALRLLREQVSAIDTSVTPFDASGMPEQITRQMFVFRFGVWIHGFEGLFGLILASI